MRPADSGLQHASTPDRNSVVAADVVDGARFPVPADSSEFDIDNPARTELDCLPGISGGMNRFIKADRCRNLFLKLRVVDDVFVMERLLEHHDVVSIHFLENVYISERVRGIR